MAVCSQEGTEFSPETKAVSTLILDFKHPELWENKCLLLKPPRVRCYVMRARADASKGRSRGGVGLTSMSLLSMWACGLSGPGVLATLSPQVCLPRSWTLPRLRSGPQPLIPVPPLTWQDSENQVLEGGLYHSWKWKSNGWFVKQGLYK